MDQELVGTVKSLPFNVIHFNDILLPAFAHPYNFILHVGAWDYSSSKQIETSNPIVCTELLHCFEGVTHGGMIVLGYSNVCFPLQENYNQS